MKNPNENPILRELREIRERMFEEAGGSLETLVKQIQERQKDTIEKRKMKEHAENVPRTSRTTPGVARNGS